jgi:hypothetical protein
VRRAVVAAVALVALVGCDRVAVRTFDRSSPHALEVRYLTRDTGDGYSVAAASGSLYVVAASGNLGTNSRVLVSPSGQPRTDDHQACATWRHQDGPANQQGLALRVRTDPSGRSRAVTVTKNVVWGANWQFNVLTWDSAQPGTWQVRGSVDLARVFWPDRRLAPFPWRVCARAEGDLVRVKGWTDGSPEPGWDDPTHTGSVRLPLGWVYPGHGGWYVGHLGAGEATSATDLTLDRLEVRTG